MTKTIVAIIALGLGLTACGAQSTVPETTRPPEKRVEEGSNYTEIDLGWDKSIIFVKSPEGTLCAVAFNDKAASTDCNWEQPVK